MPGKSITPDQVTEAIALREAGFTITAISEKLGVSIRTLNRVFERIGTKKGAVKDDLIAAARKDLIEAVTSNERIKQEAARLVIDDLAHARLLRERIAAAYEFLAPTNLVEAAIAMRAAAAAATTIKVTSDTLRHSLRTEKALDAQDAIEMPALQIIEISAEDALRMRKSLTDDLDDASAGVVAATAGEASSEPVEENERVSEGDDDPA